MTAHLIVADATAPPITHYSAHLVYADPPQNSGWDQTSYALDQSTLAQRWVFRIDHILAANSYLIICVNNQTRSLYERLVQSSTSLKFVQDLIWFYEFGTYTRQKFVPSHTQFLVYKQGDPPFHWQQVAIQSQRMEANDSRADHRGRTPPSVFQIPRVPGNSKDRLYIGKHRSSQPIELLEKFVLAYTSPTQFVLDLFSGSGSMAKACAKHGRTCVSMDINEQFVRQSYERVNNDWKRFICEDT